MFPLGAGTRGPSTLLAEMHALAEVSLVVGQGGAPVWLPAASAILGAIVGGLASYLSNTALEKRRRGAEDARWRKENVYLPLREELAKFTEATDVDGHLDWGVSFEESRDERVSRRQPHLYLWRRFTWELRATSYATDAVKQRLDAVDEAARRSNEAREQRLPVLEAAGKAVIEEQGIGPHPRNWLGGEYIHQVIRDEMRLEIIFGHPERADEDAKARFASQLNAREDVKRARASVLAAETQLVRDATDAIAALEAAIKKVAEKFERPPKY